MRIEEIKDHVYLISDCPRPIWNEKVCIELKAVGIDSILVVSNDRTPWPSRQGPLWCYSRPLLHPDNPSKAELQRISDFVYYENNHGRVIGIWTEYPFVTDQILRVLKEPTPPSNERVVPDDPCCCRPYHEGCKGEFVCHAAPIEVAQSILNSGILMTRPKLSGKPLSVIADEMHAIGQTDPEDYFMFVCFANGNCVAPDIVTMQRHAGLGLNPDQCDKQFYPGIRFYFRFSDILNHPKIAHDGIQSVKVEDQIDLDAYLAAIIVPTVDRNGDPLKLDVPSCFENRLMPLDHRKHFGLSAWSNSALSLIEERIKNT